MSKGDPSWVVWRGLNGRYTERPVRGWAEGMWMPRDRAEILSRLMRAALSVQNDATDERMDEFFAACDEIREDISVFLDRRAVRQEHRE